jgi:hypothetical protein
MPRDMKSITLKLHPERYHPKAIWERWSQEGVDIYYIDGGKAKLYIKGKPLITEAEAKLQIDGMVDVKEWLKDKAKFTTKDFSVDALEQKLKKANTLMRLQISKRQENWRKGPMR